MLDTDLARTVGFSLIIHINMAKSKLIRAKKGNNHSDETQDGSPNIGTGRYVLRERHRRVTFDTEPPKTYPCTPQVTKNKLQRLEKVETKAKAQALTGNRVMGESPETAVIELRNLIYNQQYFQQVMSSLNYNYKKKPLSELSKRDISNGFQKLKDIARLIYKLDPCDEQLISLTRLRENHSNGYYLSIPHAFVRKPRPVIDSEDLIIEELKLLTILSYMKDIPEDMIIGHEAMDFDHYLQRLAIEEMTVLSKSGKEFDLLKNQGLRVAPIEDPMTNELLCKGIYLADMASMSASHCRSDSTGGEALLLLCEVELGKSVQKLFSASLKTGDVAKKQDKYSSTLVRGRTGPTKWIDAGVVHQSLEGISMPDPNFKPSDTSSPHAISNYNKYICYDEAQIRLRYLVRIQF
ncbi:poly [ADP-ribose] polymerase [Fusarium oxysporum f. sp. lycopersici 4287]|uniref:Poly [ADP-ribose] polymerase n=1 Tax=Fusarium oxysporum f. sp. lycopersici (strain 4287 / CBS 123668 / FGSC 9935 / NRRL 34936) TaxID=426428 RepID=A0A0J9VSA9_FUSO4|nr:poly [ADP-ribose] polymerase [Fusarium oxysporum f. sp. lycopersici 4287]KNB13666.1 poly [ADP-ribose] polymerase [Fusarium oxysporum f. sp. lycopersici 4287]